MTDVIKNSQNTIKPAYVSWDGDNISQEAIATMSEAIEEYGVLDSSSAGVNNYSNLMPNTDGRPGLTRSGYNAFRPGEAIPTKIKDIIKAADRVYNKVGLIRNIIDLMADFACQGVRISHPDKRIEKFYRNWFIKINGKERSERFLNNLYKTANVIIRRQTAKITLKDRANLFKTMAEVDIKKIEEEKVRKREIPWRYTFLNPSTIEIIGGSLSSFSNIKAYAINLPEHIKHQIKNPSSKEEKDIIKTLPKELLSAARTNKLFMLPRDKTLAFHYKKDDWQDWAIPLTYPIMDDIILLEKLKLADSSALDGAISNIRIFKLGSLEHKLVPSPVAASKLKTVLSSHVGGGTIDIVWGPGIELLESKTDVHKFLGPDKYIPTLNNIYGGIGIPPTLTGSFSAGGTTNNFISLKTLVQRLEYGRNVLSSFWSKEIEMVQKAMNFSEPASIEYDYSNLGDEQSKNALLLQMSDRNLISDELLQESVKHNTRLESSRISRENQERSNDERPAKSGPFYEPQPELQLNRIALQSGQLNAEQVGLKFDGESQESAQLRASQMKTENTKNGQPQQGRPQNSKDSKPRKKKAFSPRAKASVGIWCSEAQEKISQVLNPAFLHSFSKKNMRTLTTEEHKMVENLKLGVLFSMKPFSSLADDSIVSIFNDNKKIASEIISTINEAVNEVSLDLNRKLTLSELHDIYSNIYSEKNNEVKHNF